MKCNEVFEAIMAKTKKMPKQCQIRKLLGLSQPAMSARVRRNSSFNNEELQKLKDFYSIEFKPTVSVSDIEERLIAIESLLIRVLGKLENV